MKNLDIETLKELFPNTPEELLDYCRYGFCEFCGEPCYVDPPGGELTLLTIECDRSEKDCGLAHTDFNPHR